MAEGMEISYSKQDSVLGDHTSTLADGIGDELFYSWVRGFKPTVGGGSLVEFIPASRQIPTSGDLKAVNTEDGQSGKRKGLSYKELQLAQAKFNKEGVSKDGRYAVLESYMYQDFLDSLSANQMAAFQQSADLANGIIGKFAGFNVMERATVLAFGSDAKPLPMGQALGATDNIGCFLWQKDSVSISLGDTALFQTLNDARYYGDIYSGLVKMGGRCRREDWKGVAVIVQSI
jgi:hypothetical protein